LNVINLGSFIYGDETALYLRVKDAAGAYRDMTGATAVSLSVRRRGERAQLFAVSGTVDADQVNNKGRLNFTSPPWANAAADPGTQESVIFDAAVSFTLSSTDEKGRSLLSFTVVKFP
jgi:hypothetical protein